MKKRERLYLPNDLVLMWFNVMWYIWRIDGCVDSCDFGCGRIGVFHRRKVCVCFFYGLSGYYQQFLHFVFCFELSSTPRSSSYRCHIDLGLTHFICFLTVSSCTLLAPTVVASAAAAAARLASFLNVCITTYGALLYFSFSLNDDLHKTMVDRSERFSVAAAGTFLRTTVDFIFCPVMNHDRTQWSAVNVFYCENNNTRTSQSPLSVALWFSNEHSRSDTLIDR